MVQVTHSMKRLILTTPSEKSIRNSWGNYWGYFGRQESKVGYIRLLVGIHAGETVYCQEAPKDLPNDWVGVIKLLNGSSITIFVKKTSRIELLNEGQEFMNLFDTFIEMVVKQRIHYYEIKRDKK